MLRVYRHGEDILMETATLILSTNLVFSTAIFFIVARLYVLPNFGRWNLIDLLVVLLLLQTTRHLGLMFLADGATYEGMPAVFAVTAGWGDFAASLMAFGALILVLRRSSRAIPFVWVVTIFGTIDFLVAIILATLTSASVVMGPAWWIPAVCVPALLVAHYVTFVLLRDSRLKAQLLG